MGLSKLRVLPLTSTLPLRPPKSHSISALESTHGMWYASTRCFPAPVLIDSRPVCVTLTERPFSRPLVSTSDQCSSPSALLPKRCPSLVRPSVAQSSSSPEDRPCLCPGSSDSPKLSTLISRDSSRITRSSVMVSALRFSHPRGPLKAFEKFVKKQMDAMKE